MLYLHCAVLNCRMPYLHCAILYGHKLYLHRAILYCHMMYLHCAVLYCHIPYLHCALIYSLSHAVLTLCHVLLSNAVFTLCHIRLIDFFGINNFVILFAHKKTHKLSWISPNQRDKKQIDHLLISGKWRRSLQDVRFRRGADVGSNHHLVVAHIKLKLNRTVTPTRLLKWFNVSKLKDAGIRPVVQY